MLHRARQLLVRQRTMFSNALRGHLAELGIVSAKGRNGTGELLRIIADGVDSRVSAAVRDKSIIVLHRACVASRRLRPGRRYRNGWSIRASGHTCRIDRPDT
jgi:transposase